MNSKWRRTVVFSCLLALALLLAGCESPQATDTATSPRRSPTLTIQPTVTEKPGSATRPAPSATPVPLSPTPLSPTPGFDCGPQRNQACSTSTPLSPTSLPPTLTPTPAPPVPPFSHIFVIILENREFGTVIGEGRGMPNFNLWASQYTLLTQFYAIRHPSLPNYLALIGGDTFGVTTDCNTCYQDAPILPDQIEASGRTWKGYFEDMPEACYDGDAYNYAQKHNPFMYFDSIRLDANRCQQNVAPLSQLNADLSANTLPDFALIVPNLCNDAHDCGADVADTWLEAWVPALMHTDAYTGGGLIVITWDEGQGEHTCCDLTTGGGRIATVLISPWVKNGFEDDTPYTTYSLLKTIEKAWDLPYLGHAADESNVLIKKPWKR